MSCRASTRPCAAASAPRPSRPRAASRATRSIRSIGRSASSIIARAFSSGIVSPNGRIFVLMLRARWLVTASSAKLLHDVAEFREDQLGHRQTDGVRRSREDEDGFSLRAAGGGAGHHLRRPDLFIAEHPEQLAEAGGPLL